MAVTIVGSGSITGLSVGGLPDGTVDSGTLATNSVDSAELIDGGVDNSHLSTGIDAGKLINALPSISGASLTGITTGKILQVIESISMDTTYLNSTSFTDTDLAVTITPSATSSKVLVWADFAFTQDDGATGSGSFIELVRTSTQIGLRLVGYESAHGANGYQCSIMKLDSPSSTSAITYKIRARTTDASSDFRPCGDAGSASIVAMEVSA